MSAKKSSKYPDYLKRAQSLLTAFGDGVVFKPVFGAAAAYINGAIFLTSGKFGVALKLPVEKCVDLIEKNRGSPLKYFEKGHVKKGYVVLSDAILADDKTVQALIVQSMEHCR